MPDMGGENEAGGIGAVGVMLGRISVREVCVVCPGDGCLLNGDGGGCGDRRARQGDVVALVAGVQAGG